MGWTPKLCHLVCLALVLTLAGCGGSTSQGAAAPTRPGMKVHPQSRTCMPLQAGPLQLQEEHEFGPADLGVSLADPQTALLITLYTYPAGDAAPSDQQFSAHFREVILEMAKSTGVETGRDPGGQGYAFSPTRIDRHGRKREERCACPGGRDAVHERPLVLQASRHVSTGQCGQGARSHVRSLGQELQSVWLILFARFLDCWPAA